MRLQKRPWAHDYRSKKFSHTRFFGTVDVSKLPKTLGRPHPRVEDQYFTLRCAAYAAAKNGEFIYGIRMSPDWQAKKIGELQGRSVDINGSDPNAAMNSQCYSAAGGYLPFEKSPVSMEKDGYDATTNPDAFPKELNSMAQEHSATGYVKPDGGQTTFDSIRIALFMAYDPQAQKGACVQLFIPWYEGFNAAVADELSGSLFGYHSLLAFDYDGDYLLCQNSWGETTGDKGIHRFHKSLINQIFKSWGTTLKIPKPLTPEQIAEAKKETPIGSLWRQIINAWYMLANIIMSRYGRYVLKN